MKSDGNGGMTVPGWFIRVAGIMGTVGVLWFSWATVQLLRIGFRVDELPTITVLVEQRIAVEECKRRVDGVERRVERIEKKPD